MNDLRVTGLGAVSPAGWNVAALRAALDAGIPLPATALPRPGWTRPVEYRRVPPPPVRPAFLTHPRLRRASPISQFAVAAALGALGADLAHSPPAIDQPERLGLVFCTMTGSVLYSRRFFEEALRDPATASPLLFPETVFNAPASHLAALLGLSGRVHTEVGDATCFLAAFATASLWLGSGTVDRCLVVAAEESDWLPADALALRHPRGVAAEGAGALLLERASSRPALARLEAVTDARPADARNAHATRADLHLEGSTENRLVDDLGRGGRLDRISEETWRDWSGSRRSPKRILGEAWAAGAAWQCVEAVAAIAAREARRCAVPVIGTHGHTIAARFGPASPVSA